MLADRHVLLHIHAHIENFERRKKIQGLLFHKGVVAYNINAIYEGYTFRYRRKKFLQPLTIMKKYYLCILLEIIGQ